MKLKIVFEIFVYLIFSFLLENYFTITSPDIIIIIILTNKTAFLKNFCVKENL